DVEYVVPVGDAPRNERLAARGWYQPENRIVRVCGFVLEVDSGNETSEDAPTHDADDHMRRLVAAIRRRHRSRFDGLESISAVVARVCPTEAVEGGIGGLRAAILGMAIASVGVRLPRFDERITDSVVRAIEDAPLDADARAARRVRDLTAFGAAAKQDAKVGTNRLRRRDAGHHTSAGVASRPRSTMSHRKPSPQSGTVRSMSNDDTMRSRIPGSRTELKIGSSGCSGSPGKYICVTRRVRKP